MIFAHTRDRYGRLVSACPSCGETHIGLSDAATHRWQRQHRLAHEKEKP